MTVVTGNRRLARDLRLEFNLQQAAAGLRAWHAPQILPWNAWLNRTLEESYPRETFLSNSQELAIWQNILQGQDLLDIPATAKACADAWLIIRAWRLPLNHASWQQTEDTSAFVRWASEFRAVLAKKGWIEQAALADRVQFDAPQQLELRGFDELTPQQQAVIDRLEAAGGTVHRILPEGEPGHTTRCSMAGAREEIEAAAVWARQLLETRAASRIGIVAPDLNTTTRPRIETIFRAVLGSEDAFNISLGWPLPSTPLIHAALLILRASLTNLPLAEATPLMRSPFLRGAWDNAFARAKDALALRQAGPEVSFQAMLPRLTGTRPPSQWTKLFATQLKQAGWPGDRGLNSTEHQAMTSWIAVLSEFAALDAATGAISGQAALGYLRRLAAETDFQPETQPAPIQILGVLEAAGSSFDAMWVMGMHDGVWPTPARPNPFIPIALHRELNLPHSSAKREYEFAAQSTQRLLRSAEEIVFSYPRLDGDQELGPSPLILPFSEQPFKYPKPITHRSLIFESRRLDSFLDQQGPPVADELTQHGGSNIFKLQAACPFKAYAQLRLGADELEEPAPGLDPRTRGSILHKALELLPDMSVAMAVDQALAEDGMQQPDSPGFWRVERTRLENLLREWQGFYTPHKILEKEEKKTIEVAGLKLKIKIDRVDQTAAGHTVLLDFKSSAPGKDGCLSPRPEEPQLPLYATTLGLQPDAVAFAQVKRGKMMMSGFARDKDILQGVKPAKDTDWPTLLEDWRQALHDLATEFRTGLAAVQPKSNDTCDGCPIAAMCRIREVEA